MGMKPTHGWNNCHTFQFLTLAGIALAGCAARPPSGASSRVPLAASGATVSAARPALSTTAEDAAPSPGEPPLLRPPQTPVPTPALATPLTPGTALRQTLHRLHDLSNTGAADAAVSSARRLLQALESRPRERRLAVLLTSVLRYLDAGPRDGSGGISPTLIAAVQTIPPDLVWRAAAACYERGRMRPDEVTLSFAGDCAFGMVNGDDSSIRFPSIYRRAGGGNYPFALVEPWFTTDDLTAVNFECTLTRAKETANKQWHFKGDGRYAGIFPRSSVEMVSLANNHSHDYLERGLQDTIAHFREAVEAVAYQEAPYLTTVKGIEVVVIADCTVVGENTTLIDDAPGRVVRQIKAYKKPGNIVIVFMHWGSELHTVPFDWQQRMGREFIDAGADAVVGAHPHVLQGIEQYKDKTIAYSLGNFAFGGNSMAPFPETFILRLRFRKHGGVTSPLPPSIVPCLISSSRGRNERGYLRNNYQPEPLFGAAADRVAALVVRRSARLEGGVKRISYFR
ncbi:MAG TPA: CapA family protein [Armatimonadota bacterium]|nr:CapA family protein [Armatimonadota bacterium]